MSLLDLFKRRKNLEPLVELPKEGQEIHFDEEEERAMQAGMPRLDDVVLERDTADTLSHTFAAGGLTKLAQKRLDRGETRAAASTCLKAIALWSDDYDAWLLLGQAHAAAGDFDRAKRLLGEAEKRARRIGIDQQSPFWKPKVDSLRAQIDAKTTTERTS